MRFITDEMVPREIETFLKERGHEVISSRDACLPGADDEVVAAVGDREEAILITWNRKHFKKITDRRPPGGHARHRKLGMISFQKVPEPQGISRIRQAIELIESEFAILKSYDDKRLFVTIAKNWLKFER